MSFSRLKPETDFELISKLTFHAKIVLAASIIYSLTKIVIDQSMRK
jgi:hypothetical protein